MARLERIRTYPVKSLDGVDREEATIRENGTLAGDRAFAIFDADGEVVEGPRTDRVHDITTEYDPETGALTVDVTGSDADGPRQFDLESEVGRERAAAWFSDVFDLGELALERDDERGYVARNGMGTSVISTATLETVADWFDDLTVDGVRRRMRANLEVSGVEPFWEDRFVGADAPAFTVGDVRLEGVTPCARCVVPERDPDTGEALPEFRERFVEKRRETFPEWADEAAFDHYYTLMLIADVVDADRGKTVAVGDPVEPLD
ncbi:molybdenum cofactor biosysynthesis protein [Halobiforma lacisalsi AJ5]|uniref:MOSC domain containing protein n=1 Tax=Natronobacterium lacisalsi AJ5 TaxID=358396 RepID=M0L3J0_NATLA|nr:MOSC N-terminal beta barrel domain-containing protein [Halobiforma lacisalsi]APW98170.1 molybdenum cofactor biosysynthesis protein [Halobiforma lacisalsi AJ5]EMA28152.1 MOSC domain containing protein [Halobiforma lacisalsi AJ5]